MLRLRAFLTLALAVLPFIFLGGCGLFSEKAREIEPAPEKADLPEWLRLSHRQAGALNFDYVPLDLDELEALVESSAEATEKDSSSGAGASSPKPNPTGSPYEAGTLADMIWQQKQKNKQ